MACKRSRVRISYSPLRSEAASETKRDRSCKIKILQDFLFIPASPKRVVVSCQINSVSGAAYRYIWLRLIYSYSAKCKYICFCARLIRIFGLAQYTSVRQNASKLAFALTYSYIWLRPLRLRPASKDAFLRRLRPEKSAIPKEDSADSLCKNLSVSNEMGSCGARGPQPRPAKARSSRPAGPLVRLLRRLRPVQSYSYLYLTPKILRLGIIKPMLASALDFSYL